MKRSSIIAVVLIGLGLVIVGVDTFYVKVFCGVEITINNQGTKEITNLVIAIRNASEKILKLGPGESTSFALQPTTETHITFTFSDSAGRVHESQGVYLDRHLAGNVRIEIKDDAGVAWAELIKTCLID
ncbi:hypothetical protein W02_11550 [Nitrospira sp. KM1]|uniref:hypothetical protein n=1 Tax=Nitrospira sp. KM1 TaxID=1936990 RepID=UPI0013A7B02C|nr:hypothetical protein [Nitrospira sp. KM1]BCA54015.1 hypothetical protein W02_11550 [Nitrospira sp. KM1]